VIDPLRVALWPLGPVQVADELQLPPEQLDRPLRVAVPPLGPVKLCRELHTPLAQAPCPEECQLRP